MLAENDNRLQALYVREHRTKADGTRTAHTFLKRNRAGNVHTIGMGAAIASLEASPRTRLPSEVRGNLEALTEVRDNAVHYVNASFELAKYVLEIGTACVRNFIALADKWFERTYS